MFDWVIYRSLKILKFSNWSIHYSQPLWMRVVCSTISEYERHCTTLTNTFKERGYLKSSLKDQVSKVSTMNRKDLLSLKMSSRVYQMSLAIIYHRTLPTMSKTILKNWVILRIQWRLIFANIIRCSRLRLWVGYFIYFQFTLAFF